MGREIAVKTEATETILAITKIKIQVKITKPSINFKPAILIAKPNNTPKVVAMPFPPLNLKNIVQLWPRIQHNPRMRRSVSSGINVTFKTTGLPKKTTATKPLRMSKTNTVIPGTLPNTRNALVAPTLPEPKLRISIPFNNRPNI